MEFEKQGWLRSNILNKVPEPFQSDDSLFHYTSLKNGRLILESQNLWSTLRKNSKDPVEKLMEPMMSSWISNDDESSKLIEDETKDDVSEFFNQVDLKIHEGKQLSFCCNNMENGNLGFLKPRMWNQYGDNYKGVCFVLSKKRFLSENEGLISFSDKVNYLEYHEFKRLTFDINRNELLKDREKYRNSIIQMINKKLFSKHSDYSGENEFRVVTHSDKEHDELSIKNSLIGIIGSSGIKKKGKWEFFRKYSIDNQIELRIIQWKSNDISIH